MLIALAGPAVNFVIAGGLLLAAGIGLGFGQNAFLLELTAMNLMLACFNLIPAFPMDGGRVLRALLSGWIGRPRATSFPRLGETLAIGFGVYSLLTFNFIQVALAAFIYLAAGAEEAGVLAEERRRTFPMNGDDGVWTALPVIAGLKPARAYGGWRQSTSPPTQPSRRVRNGDEADR